MKVEQKEKDFSPIVITLETSKEAMTLLETLERHDMHYGKVRKSNCEICNLFNNLSEILLTK
jgi:hypothetical protein